MPKIVSNSCPLFKGCSSTQSMKDIVESNMGMTVFLYHMDMNVTLCKEEEIDATILHHADTSLVKLFYGFAWSSTPLGPCYMFADGLFRCYLWHNNKTYDLGITVHDVFFGKKPTSVTCEGKDIPLKKLIDALHAPVVTDLFKHGPSTSCIKKIVRSREGENFMLARFPGAFTVRSLENTKHFGQNKKTCRWQMIDGTYYFVEAVAESGGCLLFCDQRMFCYVYDGKTVQDLESTLEDLCDEEYL
ncbi:hypothetical protein nvc1_125 [Namao virus]|nr:hypothetical protein nvc1_125 [Namao virus]